MFASLAEGDLDYGHQAHSAWKGPEREGAGSGLHREPRDVAQTTGPRCSGVSFLPGLLPSSLSPCTPAFSQLCPHPPPPSGLLAALRTMNLVLVLTLQ